MEHNKKILIIDDEVIIRKVIKEELTSEGYKVDVACDGIIGYQMMEKNHYDLVVLDNQMPKKKGIDVLIDIKKSFPSTIVIMMTAYASIDNAVEAMKLGASDYITKPFENKELIDKVNQILLIKDRLKLKMPIDVSASSIVGESKIIQQLRNKIHKIKDLDSTVLLTGDSGTGKGVVANEIHTLSKRSSNPFIHVNCAVLPPNLIDSELFGHVKGSFTGAHEDKKGKFEIAEGGTIFLDEISTLDHSLQAKLLTVLQEKHFERIGSSKQIPMRARIIAATNENLEDAISKNEFRSDLYYRLNVIHLECPTLRTRKEDIMLLTWHFVNNFNKLMNKNISVISEDVICIFMNYRWPGNIRELENTIESAMALADSEVLRVDDLPIRIKKSAPTPNDIMLKNASILEINEYNQIIEALKKYDGHREKTAKALGISRRTLQYRIKKYGINSLT